MKKEKDQLLAEFIRKKFKEKNISIKEFSEAIDASDQAVHQVMRGVYINAFIRIQITKVLHYKNWRDLVEESRQEEVPA